MRRDRARARPPSLDLTRAPPNAPPLPLRYVLTYLPDLQWCHVAPLERRGVFPADAGVSAGRPRWMLVPEDAGAEMDCGAARCHIMDALEKKKTKENADEEEWDIRCEA